MYDTTGYSCFNKLNKHKNIIKIIDMSSSSAQYILKIINDDIKQNHIFASMYSNKLKFYNSKNCMKFSNEILSADFYLAPSQFVKQSLIYAGAQEDNIYIVPYGVDISKFSEKEISDKKTEKIRFLFVGRLEAAKGIYYLLEAFKQLNRDDIELVIVGSMIGEISLYEPYEKYFTYEGVKLHSQMPEVYKGCDVFIFPSLWEGLSLSTIEAMASGLPVIVSQNSGTNDIITHGKEGFIVKTMDIEDLKEKIIWGNLPGSVQKNIHGNNMKKIYKVLWKKYLILERCKYYNIIFYQRLN